MKYSSVSIENDGGSPIPPLLIPLITGIESRGISAEICTRYRTYATTNLGEVAHCYYDLERTEAIGYHVRKGGWTTGNKTTRWVTNSKRNLFGLHLWDGITPTPVYLCEGETDAMAVSQYLANSGITGIALALGGEPSKDQWKLWMDTIGNICQEYPLYLCFDPDEKGIYYFQQVDKHYKKETQSIDFPHEYCYKDVCELIFDGHQLKFKGFVPPDSILTGEDLLPSERELTREYLTTGMPELDSLIGGYSPGKLILIAGAPKAGKTALTCDLACKFIAEHRKKVLYIPLELSVAETMMILGSANAGKHINDIPKPDLEKSMREIMPFLAVVKHFGHIEINILEEILNCIPRMGIDLLVLDHITAAATSYTEGLTTKLIDSMLSLVQSKLNEFEIPGIVVTHVNAQANEHIVPSNLRGSLSLAQLPSVVLGIRRCENGLSEIHTVTPDRFIGINGKIALEFDGKFKPFGSSINAML